MSVFKRRDAAEIGSGAAEEPAWELVSPDKNLDVLRGRFLGPVSQEDVTRILKKVRDDRQAAVGGRRS